MNTRKTLSRLRKARAELDAVITELEGQGDDRPAREDVRRARVAAMVEGAGRLPRRTLNDKAVELGFASPSELGSLYAGRRLGLLKRVGADVELTPEGKTWLDANRHLVA